MARREVLTVTTSSASVNGHRTALSAQPPGHPGSPTRPRRTAAGTRAQATPAAGRCVTGVADRRRRDRRLPPCQLRAAGLCAVRGKAPLVICPRRGWPPGTAIWGFNSVSWGFNSAARSSGPVCGAAAVVPGLASSSGRLSLCFPDDQASCCGCPVRPCVRRGPGSGCRRFRRSHAWTGREAGAAASFRLRNAARPALAVLAWSGDGFPVWGCTTTGGVQVPPRTLFRKSYLSFRLD